MDPAFGEIQRNGSIGKLVADKNSSACGFEMALRGSTGTTFREDPYYDGGKGGEAKKKKGLVLRVAFGGFFVPAIP